MTAPRLVAAGATYLLTRRCAQREFLFVPRGTPQETFGYCLAREARRYQIDIHAYCIMSNHVHIVLTDPRGVVPDFCRSLFGLSARAINAELGRWENLWASEPVSLVPLVAPDDVLAKLVYTITNAPAAGLVASHRDWPGLVSKPRAYGGNARTFDRPKKFFRKVETNAERESLSITLPPAFEAEGARAFGERLEAAVAAREEELGAARARRGDRVMGKTAIVRQRRTARPSTREPRRGLRPSLAAKHRIDRAEALAELHAFRLAYNAARTAWLASKGDVVFPRGTFGMRHWPRVVVEGTNPPVEPPLAP